MSTFVTVIKSCTLIFLLAMLGACSGGGDSGSSNGGPLSGDTISISASALNFEAVHNGDTPADQVIEVTYSGAEVAFVGAAYPPGEERPPWLIATSSGSQSPLDFTFSAVDTSLDTGTYSTRFYIGTARIDGSIIESVPVDITYVVKSVITPAPEQVDFELGATPLMQQFTLSTEGQSIPWSLSVDYQNGDGWLDVTYDNNDKLPATLTLEAQIRDPGRYAADVVITSLNGSDVLLIPVNYTVPAPRSNPSVATYTIDPATSSGQLTQTISLLDGFFAGNDLEWSVSSDVAWITVNPTSGVSNTSREFTLAINTAALEDIPPGRHEGVLTVSAAGVPDLLIPVKLSLNLPLLRYVAPYVAVSDQSDEVIVRGAGFDHIGAQAISFGGTTASGINVVSDTEFRINNPPLSAGRYLITVDNALGLARSNAELVSVEPTNFSSAKIADRNGFIGARSVYDAERLTLFIGDPNTSVVERYRFNQTWSTDSLAIDGLRDIAFSPDGKLLLAATYTGIVYISPDSFTVIDEVASPTNLDGTTVDSLAFTNDGRVIALIGGFTSKTYVFDINNKSFELLSNQSFLNPVVTASANHSRLFVTDSSISSALVYHYNAGTDEFTETSISMVTRMVSFDRAGRNVILDSRYVFDENYTDLGSLPQFTPSVMSHGGTLAHGYNSDRLHVYNITQTDGLGGFVEIGSGTPVSNQAGVVGRLLLTHDGGNIFIIGNTLSVEPTP